MSFYTSLSGLKGAQTSLSAISNNLANVASTGFKKSRASFGDMFAAAPTQTTKMATGQGTRLNGVIQQFSQGTLESTDKTLDLAIAGEGFFVVKGEAGDISYTRNGEFGLNVDRKVMGNSGTTLQLLPVDAAGDVTSTALGDAVDFVLPEHKTGEPNNSLVNVNVGNDGLVTATYADGTSSFLGKVALAGFNAVEGLRPIGNSHWQSTGDSGPPVIGEGMSGSLGTIRSGAVERANVDVTEELVSLIAAQRNFQANAKAIETASNMTQTIFNIT